LSGNARTDEHRRHPKPRLGHELDHIFEWEDTVADLLPRGTRFSHSTPIGACVSSAEVVTCSVGQLANGGSKTINITLIPAQTGFLYNGFAVFNNDNGARTGDGDAHNDATAARTLVANPLFCANPALN
jgi:hypothetical protein